MKKVLAFLTALTALFCTACNEKNDNISENPPVGDVTSVVSETNISENTETSEVSEENSVISQPAAELKHYTLDDFKEIKVNLKVQETAPPVEFKEYDLSGIELEAKKSPCKLPENVKIENICPDSKNIATRLKMEHEEYCQKFMEFHAPILEAEEKPVILYTAFDGENLYYLGDYDNACPAVSHNFEIFKYNPETGDNISIYEYSDGTEGMTIADMVYNNGLFLFTLESDGLKTQKFDDKTGEFVSAPDSFADQVSVNSIADPIYTSSYKKYIDLNMKLSDTSGYDVELVRENGKITAKSDRYTLKTGISVCKKILSEENRLILLQSDDYYSVLHTFDFEKMEKYTTELSMEGNLVKIYPMGKNILIHYDDNVQQVQQNVFLIPELGAGFNLNDTDYTHSMRVEQSLIGLSDNELAILNHETFISTYYYWINVKPFIHEDPSTMNVDDYYTPSDTNPLKKLYIFETD